jgi:hypothetical protein
LPGLNIPPNVQRGLRKLLSLSDEQTAELMALIDAAARKAFPASASGSDMPTATNVNETDASEILETIIELTQVRVNADVSVEEFVSDICDFLRSADSKEFRVSEEKEVARIASRLRQVLTNEKLTLEAKATVLRYEHEKTLCSLRILTDARPVFGNDPADTPKAAVVFHMLKLAYHEAGSVREVFVSLDEDDLEKLKDAVLRAELKSESLKRALEERGVAVIT